MAEPTLVQVFGANATQDATTITITKADLVAVGLTAGSNNTAESLLTAIILRAKNYLTTANHDANIDQSVTITDGYIPSFVIRNDVQYRQDTVTVAFEKLAGSTTIDPDDY
ncbi:hypothetical protein VF14_35185 [Nostoc linckia z18]|uniref:Uncharacterized protein n=2 Tax=Nostoc linckia TaxID=92942 RepID=A0A9Q5Z511_NOSLI|nr:hypothetical protein [Nostoc linckia]PHJ57576.1 hypothetical protein VF05_35440 [Nostoc linckia z3]PHK28918.1 hypothetical protein VF12_31890 [Nostoc linckia z15]PHK38841.1 hypothetical protein VF13_35345 [Nostoc linckia z16]PHJ54491.1 hypothetical protein VF02_36660 [Nostoc linckia z1]PHJ58991.1 hypothetical protein VF03_34945 [Nostoc linckia z2]